MYVIVCSVLITNVNILRHKNKQNDSSITLNLVFRDRVKVLVQQAIGRDGYGTGSYYCKGRVT